MVRCFGGREFYGPRGKLIDDICVEGLGRDDNQSLAEGWKGRFTIPLAGWTLPQAYARQRTTLDDR